LSVEKCESGTRRKWREEELWKIGRKNVIQIEPPDAGEYGDVHVISLKLLIRKRLLSAEDNVV